MSTIIHSAKIGRYPFTGERRFGFNLTLLAMGMAALSGCVNQREQVQKYRDVVDAGLPRPKFYVPNEPLGLDRALALANQDNEQISLQGETYLQALIAKNRAVAAFLPTVSFQPSFSIEQQPTTNTVSGVAAPVAAESSGFVIRDHTYQSLSAPVVGGINLFNGFSDVSTLRGAEQTIEQQRQLLLNEQEIVLLNVAQTYYQVLRSEQQVAVLRAAVEVDQARLRDVQSRFAQQLALALEVSQTRSQAAGDLVTLTQAQNDVRNGRRTLAFLLGVRSVDGPLIDSVAVPDSLSPVDEFVRLAQANRQDLLAADAAVNAARYAVDAAIGQYYPSVSLNVSGFLYREYFSDASKWDAILQANLPIFSAGIIEANVRTAWSKLRQAALMQTMLRRQIESDMRNAYDNLVTSADQLANLREEVGAAAQAADQSEQLRRNGLALPLDVLIAEQTYLNAQLQYTSEMFDRSVFYLDLLRVAGQLNPKKAVQWHPTTVPSAPSALRLRFPGAEPSTQP